MNYNEFITKGITEKQHLIENQIDTLRSHYEVNCEMDLAEIKLSLQFADSENEFTELLKDLENIVKSYRDDEYVE